MREEIVKNYTKGIHIIGRITLILGLIMLVAFPFLAALIYDGTIDYSAVLKGFINVGIIYIPVSIVEFLVYAPILGSGATYLAFITGNLTNMKIPCVINARDIVGTKEGTVEDEIVSTLSVAASALTTMLVIAIGVVLLVPLTPLLESPILRPAFDNVVAALFGALGLKYFIKSIKISFLPLTLMSLLCIFVPSMISQTSILIIPSGAIAILIAYILNKKKVK